MKILLISLLLIGCSLNPKLDPEVIKDYWCFYSKDLGYTEVQFNNDGICVFSKLNDLRVIDETWMLINDSMLVKEKSQIVKRFKLIQFSDSTFSYFGSDGEKVILTKIKPDYRLCSLKFFSKEREEFLVDYRLRMNRYFKNNGLSELIIDSSSVETISIDLD